MINLEVPKSLIHIEQFGTAKKLPPNEGIENALLEVQLNQQTNTLSVPKGKTILQTLKAANLEPPYSRIRRLQISSFQCLQNSFSFRNRECICLLI